MSNDDSDGGDGEGTESDRPTLEGQQIEFNEDSDADTFEEARDSDDK